MRRATIIGLFFGWISIAGCALVPSGDACVRDRFPNYMTCYETMRAKSSPAYDALIQYGRALSAGVTDRTIANEKAFELFDEKRLDVQRQLAEAQSRAVANAMRRSAADPK